MNRPEPGYALADALHYAGLGYTVLPIKEGKKYPPFKWKQYQTEKPAEPELHSWFAATRYGVALVCGQLVMVDVDHPNEIDFVLEHCVQKNSKHDPPVSTTPRGGYHIHTKARDGVAQDRLSGETRDKAREAAHGDSGRGARGKRGHDC